MSWWVQIWIRSLTPSTLSPSTRLHDCSYLIRSGVPGYRVSERKCWRPRQRWCLDVSGCTPAPACIQLPAVSWHFVYRNGRQRVSPSPCWENQESLARGGAVITHAIGSDRRGMWLISPSLYRHSIRERPVMSTLWPTFRIQPLPFRFKALWLKTGCLNNNNKKRADFLCAVPSRRAQKHKDPACYPASGILDVCRLMVCMFKYEWLFWRRRKWLVYCWSWQVCQVSPGINLQETSLMSVRLTYGKAPPGQKLKDLLKGSQLDFISQSRNNAPWHSEMQLRLTLPNEQL